ncbi:MAG TPA: putative Ig domain-containing protein, partial [Solirubrobacterales bacterium]|nr:putative Ig domain-containing protein [Solirubrobacterales bacterium]
MAAMVLCIAAFCAAGVSSASAAEGCTRTAMYVVAHEDDTLLFQSPSVLQDIQSEHCVRTLFLTAGDAGRAQSYWAGREDGAEDAYAQMAGVKNEWTSSVISANGHSIHLETLKAKPTISIAYLRLPDGGTSGTGFPLYSNQSLMKLWNSEHQNEAKSLPQITSIKAVDNSATYGYEDLIETLEELIEAFGPSQVYTQNYTVPLISADHPDHVATGLFTREASKGYPAPHRLLGFEDYETTGKAQNVFGTLLGAKSAAFYQYGTHDSDACKSEGACTGTSYASWLLRQYPLSTSETIGVVANAGFAQLSETSTSVTLDGSGSSRQGGGSLTYAWTQTGGPAVALSSSTAQKPTFTTPSHPTKLTFSLTVKGGATSSAADTVVVKVPSSDPTPTAIAGSGQTVASGAKVTLDGSESWDPNSLSLQYSWLQTSGPLVTLANSATAAPSFTAPTGPTTLKFSLMVSNGTQTSAPATVTINVKGIAPSFKSATSAPFTTGVAGSFKVETTASPTATVTREGTLPPGLTYTDNGDGTATIAGTPTSAAAPPAGSENWPLKFKATNSEGVESQTLTLTVTNPGVKPEFSSATSTGFTTGKAGTFTVSASGEPGPAITLAAGSLPAGVTFTPGTGSATLSGTPDAAAVEPGQSLNFPLTFKAKSGAGEKTQSFTLTVTNPGTAPTIETTGPGAFTTGAAGSFTITATGAPAPSLAKVAGALPPGLSFADQGNGSAKISGTPTNAAASPGETRDYAIEVEAANVAGSVKKSLTLKVTNPGTAPDFTSGTSASFTTGVAATFSITTSGAPAPAITKAAGSLPPGLTFTDNGNGTAKISGTPTAAAAPPGESQAYNVELLAKNVAGQKPQGLTVTVKNPGTAPSFKSEPQAAFTVGVAKSFIVSTNSNPTATITRTGSLPPGLSFADNGDGTATISGTATNAAAPPADDQDYPLSFEASAKSGTASQSFTLTVFNPGTAPTIETTGPGAFTTGAAGSFTITASGAPTPSLAKVAGALPPGLSFADQGNGSAKVTGTPTNAAALPGETREYPIEVEASSGAGSVKKSLTLKVTNPGTSPEFTSATSGSLTTGVAATFNIATSGAPAPAITKAAGTLPPGMSFTDNGDGTAKISGTPTAAAAPPGESQPYNVELLAKNVAGQKTQAITLTVKNPGTPPSFSSEPSTTFTVGTAKTFTIAASGDPVPTVAKTSGSLPVGLTLTPNANGSMTLSGTATEAAADPGKSKGYSLNFEASSAAGTKTQTLSVTVVNPGTPPSFESADTTTFTVGTAKTFTVSTKGNPLAGIELSGTLPPGLSFTDNGNGTAKISGTATNAAAPPAQSQPYALTFKASSLAGEESQSFTLTVFNPGTAPTIETTGPGAFTTGAAGSFTITASGAPTP